MKTIRITQIISMLCNCYCDYCMCGTELTYRNPTNESSLEDLIKFYDNINKDIPVIFKITGGEPLHPVTVNKTVELVKFLLENKTINYIQINTNGYFDIPQYLLDNKKVQFQFSLDGDKDYQNKITGVDIYDKLISNIDKVISNGSDAHIMCVVTPDNHNQVRKVMNIGQAHNISVNYQYVAPVGKGENIKRNEEIAKKVISQINNLYPKTCRPFIETCRASLETEELKFSVDAQGNIILCPYMRKYKSGLTIYNTKVTEENNIVDAINNKIQGRSCCRPN